MNNDSGLRGRWTSVIPLPFNTMNGSWETDPEPEYCSWMDNSPPYAETCNIHLVRWIVVLLYRPRNVEAISNSEFGNPTRCWSRIRSCRSWTAHWLIAVLHQSKWLRRNGRWRRACPKFIDLSTFTGWHEDRQKVKYTNIKSPMLKAGVG